MADTDKSTDKTAKPGGFEEAPQAPLTGSPLSGDIASWAQEIEAESESPAAKLKLKASP